MDSIAQRHNNEHDDRDVANTIMEALHTNYPPLDYAGANIRIKNEPAIDIGFDAAEEFNAGQENDTDTGCAAMNEADFQLYVYSLARAKAD